MNVNTDNLFHKCFDFKTKMLSHFLFVDFELNKPFLNISEDQKNLYIQLTVKKIDINISEIPVYIFFQQMRVLMISLKRL